LSLAERLSSRTDLLTCFNSMNRKVLIATQKDLNLTLTERARMEKKKRKKQKTRIPRRTMKTIVVNQLENGDGQPEQTREIGLGGRRNERKSILIE